MIFLIAIGMFLIGFLFGLTFEYGAFKARLKMGMTPYIAKDKSIQWKDKQ